VRLEGLGRLKNPMTSSGNEPVTFRLVVKCPTDNMYSAQNVFHCPLQLCSKQPSLRCVFSESLSRCMQGVHGYMHVGSFQLPGLNKTHTLTFTEFFNIRFNEGTFSDSRIDTYGQTERAKLALQAHFCNIFVSNAPKTE
jgi:hypothetical protein